MAQESGTVLSYLRFPSTERLGPPVARGAAGLAASALGYLVASRPLIAAGGGGLIVSISVPTWLLVGSAIFFSRPVYTSNWGPDWLPAIPPFLLIVWLTRRARNSSPLREGLRQPGLILYSIAILLFVAWSWISTLEKSGEAPALLQISVLAVISISIAWIGCNARERVAFWAAAATYAAVDIILSVAVLPERMTGFLSNDPHQLGFIALAGLAGILGDSLTLTKRIKYPLIALLIAGILATQTRSVWLGLVLLLIVRHFRRPSALRAFLVLVVLSGLSIAMFSRVTAAFDLNPESAELRLRSLESGLTTLRESPLYGAGWSGVATSLDAELLGSRPFNLFVNLASTTGYVGLILFLVFLGMAWRMAGIWDRSSYLFITSFVGLSLSGMSIYAGSTVTLLFFFSAGMAASHSRFGIDRSTEG